MSALYSSVDWVFATGDRLFQCGIVRGGGGGILQGITVCLVSVVLSTMWWPGSFQTVSRGHILVFFNRHCSTMNLVKEKQGGLVPPGLKRWPFKLIKHFAGTRGKMIHGAKWNSAIFQMMMPYMTFLTQTECAFRNPPYYKKGSAKTEQS